MIVNTDGAITKEEIRTLAENDLNVFATLINPHRVYGPIHHELFDWWQREDALDNQLVLLPRDHQKSHMMAVRVTWEITRNPAVTVLYVSATASLAEKQLRAIQQMLTSPIYRRYWPEMVHEDEGKRARWNTTEIEVDHPLRKEEGVRDPTVIARGITANITGHHCDIAVLDDLVVPRNAYTEEGRNNVMALYSQLASIETTGSKEWVVGTRYHPDDLYSHLLSMEAIVYEDEDTLESTTIPIYEVFERVVEDSFNRDGTGKYLWERTVRKDGKAFGFDRRQLAIKKAKYLSKEQFYAQYYNDPNDPSVEKIKLSDIQYYNPKFLSQNNGFWYYKDRKLNVYAAMDFAFSTSKKADYTAIVVIGVDFENNVYVLDIIRFKTTKISEMFMKLLAAYNKWDFRKVAAEVSVAQVAIVREFKNYMKSEGVFFRIEEHRPTRKDGSKEERIDSILSPRYENHMVYHPKGSLCHALESELIQNRPEHDDIKDALASAINIAKAPLEKKNHLLYEEDLYDNVVPLTRFGGV